MSRLGIIKGKATLFWDHAAQAVVLAIPVEEAACPDWWHTDEEVELFYHGDNLVVRHIPTKVCELCGKDHQNRFTVCRECENL